MGDAFRCDKCNETFYGSPKKGVATNDIDLCPILTREFFKI